MQKPSTLEISNIYHKRNIKMGIFDLFKPNVEKMEDKKNVEGLIKALENKRDDVR
jgi:hypothetical protein